MRIQLSPMALAIIFLLAITPISANAQNSAAAIKKQMAKIQEQVASAESNLKAMEDQRSALQSAVEKIDDREMQAKTQADLQTIVQKMSIEAVRVKNLHTQYFALQKKLSQLERARKAAVNRPRGSSFSNQSVLNAKKRIQDLDAKIDALAKAMRTAKDEAQQAFLQKEMLELEMEKQKYVQYVSRLAVRGSAKYPLSRDEKLQVDLIRSLAAKLKAKGGMDRAVQELEMEALTIEEGLTATHKISPTAQPANASSQNQKTLLEIYRAVNRLNQKMETMNQRIEQLEKAKR